MNLRLIINQSNEVLPQTSASRGAESLLIVTQQNEREVYQSQRVSELPNTPLPYHCACVRPHIRSLVHSNWSLLRSLFGLPTRLTFKHGLRTRCLRTFTSCATWYLLSTS